MNMTSPEIHEEMSRRGKRGGRPKLPSLVEIQCQQAALRRNDEIERRSRLPGGDSMAALRARLELRIKEGGLPCCGRGSSPEGASDVRLIRQGQERFQEVG